jgi:hypothetical protein
LAGSCSPPKSTVQLIDLHVRTYSHPSYKIVLIVSSQLFPVVEIFGLADTIPFHVQLTGFVSSLLGFVPELEDTEKSTIVGSLVRQIVFDLNGRHMTRSIVLGDAKMTPRPSSMRTRLGWGMRCNVDATVGTFDAGCVRVQVSRATSWARPAFHGNECLPRVAGLHRAQAQAAVRRDVL